MKLTKLSLVAALAVSAAMAGGDIAPVEPVVEAPAVASSTTINGKLQAYYITDDNADLFDKQSSSFATAVTLDVSHKFNEIFTANFTALGYVNLIDEPATLIGLGDSFMEGHETGAYLNVANLTATFGDTTAVLGRQLLATPMIQGYDWLLAPASFEAYTLVNSSIENVTLVGSYVTKVRGNNSGDFDNNNLDGDNYALGASYDDKTLSGSLWYNNIDVAGYSQVYVDAGYNFGSVAVAAQYANTDWDGADSSDVFGIKASTEVSGISLMAAYDYVSDNTVGYVSWNGLYTNSWNTTVANSLGNSFKVEAATEISDISVTGSYAYYEYDVVGMEDGHEFDLILGYDVTDSISVGAVYSNTDYGTGDAVDQIELIATYKF